MSTELVVRTIKFEPAKIEFNYDQLSTILDETLVKYSGLEFTEKTAPECKKTIAELRKGKTLLDTYRKDTKKDLTASVTAFENRIKELAAKFDQVIDPLTAQHDQFEADRKERKRKEIQSIIDALIIEQGLNEKFAPQMIIPEDYFNKGKIIKDIKAEITTLANSLGVKQDKEAADQEIIKTKVELANAKLGANLIETPYLNLLQHDYPITEIVEKINKDAEEYNRRAFFSKTAPVPSAPAPSVSVGQVISDKSDTLYSETFEISGTEAQLDVLEQFLKDNAYGYKIIDTVN